jgi:electron transfer flavoprotein alpha subunit
MICIFIETRDGKIKKASLEALSEGRRKAEEMNQEAVAVLIGQGLEGLASDVFSYGAAKAYFLEYPLLSSYSPQGYVLALRRLVDELRPEIIFFSATSLGKDLAPRLAAGLNVGLASDCTKVEVKDGRLEYTRPIFAGKAQLSFFLKSKPQVATLRPNVFPLRERAEAHGEVVKKDVSFDENLVKARVIEFVCGKGEELDVSEADIIVSGGRGMKGPENFALLRELTAVLPRSAVGASRSAVDSGWIGHQHQVGQTGKTVSPTLYMAFGISGAIQHLAGMSSSKYIVAVNKDPEAPIFKVADYGIVGDLFQVIPALKEEFRKLVCD